jgi:hypothetical protein
MGIRIQVLPSQKKLNFDNSLLLGKKIIIFIFLKKSKNYFSRTIGTKAHLKIKVLGSEFIFVIFIVSETLVASITPKLLMLNGSSL